MAVRTQNVLKLIPEARDFAELIKAGGYYVDKTPYLKEIFEFNSRVLIIRPDGFGKTLMMSALRHFLETDYEHPGDTSKQRELFKGLKILEDQDFCEKHLGQHPVVFFAPKPAGGDTFDQAYKGLCEDISSLYGEFSWLLHSDRLDEDDRRNFRRAADVNSLLNGGELGREHARVSLHDLCRLLSKHCQKEAVLIIDGLDDLLQQAAEHGYFEEMSGIISPMLSRSSFYTSDYMCEEIISGRLRPVGGDLFGSDLDHFDANTALTQNRNLCTAFGFTPDEAKEALTAFGLESLYGKAREECGGYSVYGRELFCPGDLISFIASYRGAAPAAAARENGSLITAFLPKMRYDDAQSLQKLLDGGTAKLWIDEYLSHGPAERITSRFFWNILFYRGFLTVAKRCPDYEYEFRIPNLKMRKCLAEPVTRYREEPGGQYFKAYSERIVRLLTGGGYDRIAAAINMALSVYVSLRVLENGRPAEGWYCDLFRGILLSAQSLIGSRQACSDNSCAAFTSASGDTGTVIALRYSPEREGLQDQANEALGQLEGCDEAAALRKAGAGRIFEWGIALWDRQCAVAFKELNP